MNLTIEVERETDGRWIAEVRELPGCLAYGKTRADALAKTKALALRVLADLGRSTANLCRWGKSCSPWHEPVGFAESATVYSPPRSASVGPSNANAAPRIEFSREKAGH